MQLSLPFFKHYHIATGFARETAIERLEKRIYQQSFFSFQRSPKPFWGNVNETGFNLQREIDRYLRNPFRPVAFGKFVETQDGLRVDITLILHPFIMGLSILVFTIGGISMLMSGWPFLLLFAVLNYLEQRTLEQFLKEVFGPF